MRISNKQLAQALVNVYKDGNELVDILTICYRLYKKYGRAVYNSHYQTVIASHNPAITAMMLMLQEHKKDRPELITVLIRLVKSLADNYKASFVVHSPEEIDSAVLVKHVHQHVQDASVEIEKNEKDTQLQVAGEGMYYKRSLDMDLQRLLHV